MLVIGAFSMLNAQRMPDYSPLDKAQKKLFKSSYIALIKAADEGNKEAFLLFAPGMIVKYESILLDPQCVDLRNAYKDIKSRYQMYQLSLSVDSLKTTLNQSIKEKDFPSIFKVSSSLLSIYRQNGNDSLFKVYQTKIDSLILSNYHNNSDFAVFTSIEQFPYISQNVIDTLKSQLELTKRDALTRLSANLDYDEISDFQKQYPSLFSEDVAHLKDMAQANLKTSALRSALKGNTQSLIDYRDRFGAKDNTVDKVLENSLFKAFEVSQNEETAGRYLLYFPDSPRAAKTKEYLTSLKQQKEMEELARQVLIRKYE